VKVTVFFRGRQITHPELGHAMLQRVAGMITDVAVVEQTPRLEGRHMSMMVVAK
jgi:translation initiation factor IF-3